MLNAAGLTLIGIGWFALMNSFLRPSDPWMFLLGIVLLIGGAVIRP